MRKLIIFLLFIQIVNQVKGQSKNDLDFVLLKGQDTIYCFITEIARSAGNVYNIEYYDIKKQKHTIGKSDVRFVKSMRVAGRTLDLCN